MQSKTKTQLQNEWIEAQNQIDQMEALTEAINDLVNMKCDFTQWNILESINNLAFEQKRANDLKEQELNN